MKKYVLALIFVFLGIVYFIFSNDDEAVIVGSGEWWEVQSVDTMKYSRDLAREKLNDEGFDSEIQLQMEKIAALGATHVAIGTPYDPEFVPFLARWVKFARQNNLRVWFRGNFSGWEEWFGYARITPDAHLRMTREFILSNRSLFEDGDIFTSCPECENGGPGDPRITGEVERFREFLIDEYQVARGAFEQIGKKVISNYFSMNGDVALLVMDRETTFALDGVVVVDHYAASPETMVRDVKLYAERSGGKVVLGEFGVPIPDIHGDMTEEEQAGWLREVLGELAREKNVIGLNYWTLKGGSTELWGEKKRSAAVVLEEFYKPKKLNMRVTNAIGSGIGGAIVKVSGREFKTDSRGNVEVLFFDNANEVAISAPGYKTYTQNLTDSINTGDVHLENERESILFKVIRLFLN